jgi:hypothetical protein
MKKVIILFIISVAFTAVVSAQTKVSVKFARGLNSWTVRGSVSGYQYVDYMLDARSGQGMSVSISSSNKSAQFVIFDKNMENLEGSHGDTYWWGRLPSDGIYTVRVLLPRSDARRTGSKANYSLLIKIY